MTKSPFVILKENPDRPYMKGSRPLSAQEISAILAAIASNRYPLRDRALFILGHRAGFRISELLSLNVQDVVNGLHGPSRITVSRKNMKGQKEARTVDLHPEAQNAIREWLESIGPASPETPLFRSRKGGGRMRRQSYWAILNRAYKKCGLSGKLGTHTLRKTFAKRVHKNLGENIFKTQKAMGHKNVNSTVSYLAIDDDEISNAILKD